MGVTQTVGQRGEDYARRWLESQGYKFVERNWRCRMGEVDLVMRKDGELVFVEVRVRKSAGYGDALESVGFQKQQKLLRTLAAYQQAHDYWGDVRIDVVGVTKKGEEWEVKHVKNAVLG